MKINTVYLLLIFLLFNSSLFAQELNNKIQAYFKENRESIYLHLNKSIFSKGENIWFQGYVLNRKTNLLSLIADKAYVQVFNEEGVEVAQYLYKVNSGIFDGHVEFSQDFEPGKYYIVGQTDWMKNFKESEPFVQSIQVLDNQYLTQDSKSEKYDFQILPESGYLVDGIASTIGMKLINQNGLGVKFEAEIYTNGQLISSTKSNLFGMAKTSITPDFENDYTVKVKLPNNQTIEKKITDIQKNGVVLNVRNNIEDAVYINLNYKFLNTKRKNTNDHKLIIHQEGKLFEIPIKNINEDYTYKIVRENLFYGVNTVTYFFKNKPLAERLFFNYPPNISSADQVKNKLVTTKAKDSVAAQLKIDELKESIAYMSVSIVPKESIASMPNNSLASSLYLSPFVKGYIENPSYYFKNISKRKKAELDLLLLNQGWSRYNWKDIFEYEPKDIIQLQKGLKATLEIKSKLTRHQKELLVQNTLLHDSEVYSIPEDKIINLKNNYLIEGETLTVSLIGKNKKLQNIYEYSLDIQSDSVNNTLPKTAKPLDKANYLKKKQNKSYSKNIILNTFKSDDVLDEAIVKTTIEKEKEEFDITHSGKFLKLDEHTKKLFFNVGRYLDTKGWDVNRYLIRISSSNPIYNGKTIPVVYLDGRILRPNEHRDVIDITMDEIESIYMDRNVQFGAGVGINEGVGGGLIRIKTKPSFYNINRKPSSSIQITNAFKASKKYYMPEYQFYNTESFKKIGAIDFKTNIISENGTINFKFYNTKLPEVVLYIEGITNKSQYIQLEFPVVIEE